MKQSVLLLAMLLGVTTVADAAEDANIKAVTLDGRPVVLKSDNTWAYAEPEVGNPTDSAELAVSRMWEMGDACRLQFRLTNNLGYRISTLVPRLSVQNKDGIIYDTRSISFASVKPTDSQYTEVQFSGIGCHNIARIKVYDAARCRMGKIDQWNEAEGECLSHIYVEPSQDITISK